MLLSVNWLCHKIIVRCISSTRSVAYHQPQGCISSHLAVYIIKPSACISSTARLYIITACRVYHQALGLYIISSRLHKNPLGSVCFCHFLPCFHCVLKALSFAFLGFDFSGALFRFKSTWLRAPIFLLDILFFICYNICANI